MNIEKDLKQSEMRLLHLQQHLKHTIGKIN